MEKWAGYLLSGLGILAFVFFDRYRGTAIPLKELWFVVSCIVFLVGLSLVVKHKWKKLQDRSTITDPSAAIAELQRTGEKIRVTLDNCEIKTRTWQQEVIDTELPGRAAAIDGLFNSNRNYKTEEVRQTYIVFVKEYKGVPCQFVSQATNDDPLYLRSYLDRNQGVNLYVDPDNPSRYYFELPF